MSGLNERLYDLLQDIREEDAKRQPLEPHTNRIPPKVVREMEKFSEATGIPFAQILRYATVTGWKAMKEEAGEQ